MMTFPETMALPFRIDESGVIRIGQTRVTLTTLLEFYRQGYNAEGLHEGFPTVSLADIHAVIAYYLENQTEVDAYLEEQRAEAHRIRREHESLFPPTLTKADLQARLDARKRD